MNQKEDAFLSTIYRYSTESSRSKTHSSHTLKLLWIKDLPNLEIIKEAEDEMFHLGVSFFWNIED